MSNEFVMVRREVVESILQGAYTRFLTEAEVDGLKSAIAEPSAPKCKTCNGTGMVDDGEITCSEGGIPYENGPVKCVKDCPDCAPIEHDERAAFDPIEWLETEISAVDTWYRGNPSYEHDAGWMKDQALRLVSEARAVLERKPS